jgi:hypothetical protein
VILATLGVGVGALILRSLAARIDIPEAQKFVILVTVAAIAVYGISGDGIDVGSALAP